MPMTQFTLIGDWEGVRRFFWGKKKVTRSNCVKTPAQWVVNNYLDTVRNTEESCELYLK